MFLPQKMKHIIMRYLPSNLYVVSYLFSLQNMVSEVIIVVDVETDSIMAEDNIECSGSSSSKVSLYLILKYKYQRWKRTERSFGLFERRKN